MTSAMSATARPISPGSEVVVLSVPTDHVYVRHLEPLPGQATLRTVRRLRDPQDPWWPPPALDPEWLASRTDEFDVYHVHFGFDARPAEELQAIVDILGAAGRPLVQTVHDLRNPHHPTRELHDAQLDVLVPAADALITLTAGAAAEIRRRWGRTATVLPHPHVVDLAELRRRRSRAGATRGERPFTVGLHLKSLRPCMSGVPMVVALLRAVEALPGALLKINVHRDVAEPTGTRYERALAEVLAVARRRGAQVDVHDYFDDHALWDYLESLDVSVLPYRYGTHSGWLEACRDLGTGVIAPDVGYYADQGPVRVFHLNEDEFDVDSLVHAVCDARLAGRPDPVPISVREQQRRELAEAHVAIYESVLR